MPIALKMSSQVTKFEMELWYIIVHCEKRRNLLFWTMSQFPLDVFNICLLHGHLKLSIISKMSNDSDLNPFPHTTILQQTTLNEFCQIMENLNNWMDNLWQKVENMLANGEIARSVQFLLLSLCFQKAVCCRGVRKRLYEGKG